MSNTKSKVTSLRIPLEDYELWDTLAAQSGLSKTEVICTLLRSAKRVIPATAARIEFAGESHCESVSQGR